jgi:hypothetical protein
MMQKHFYKWTYFLKKTLEYKNIQEADNKNELIVKI